MNHNISEKEYKQETKVQCKGKKLNCLNLDIIYFGVLKSMLLLNINCKVVSSVKLYINK